MNLLIHRLEPFLISCNMVLSRDMEETHQIIIFSNRWNITLPNVSCFVEKCLLGSAMKLLTKAIKTNPTWKDLANFFELCRCVSEKVLKIIYLFITFLCWWGRPCKRKPDFAWQGVTKLDEWFKVYDKVDKLWFINSRDMKCKNISNPLQCALHHCNILL